MTQTTCLILDRLFAATKDLFCFILFLDENYFEEYLVIWFLIIQVKYNAIYYS